MTVAPESSFTRRWKRAWPEEPEAWCLTLGRRGLQVRRASHHLQLLVSPALLAWLVSLGAGGAAAHWLL